MFQSYNDIPPLVWKGKHGDIYFLEACQRVRTAARICSAMCCDCYIHIYYIRFFLYVLIHAAYLLLAMRSGELCLEYYSDCILTMSAKQL